MKTALLAGGTGAAKLAAGLARVLTHDDLTIVANTADDERFWGLLVCPDVDAILYRLGGVFNEKAGFGVRDESFHVLGMLRTLGEPVWFALGDRDIALHLLRDSLLRSGMRLTDAIAELARRIGVGTAVVPMSDEPVRTHVLIDGGELAFQQWFVQQHCEPAVRGLRFDGIDAASASPEAARAVSEAEMVIIGPSNPLLSIDPILGVLREHLDRGRTVAVSPVVAGRSLKGPTVDMLRQLGHEPTAVGVARHYAEIAATFVIDTADAASAAAIAALGMQPVVCDTIMDSADREQQFAAELMRLVTP